MACQWSFRIQLLITLFSVYQVSSWDVKVPTSATAGSVAAATYSRRPGDETAFAVLLVQIQPTQTFSVITKTTATDEDPHTVSFQIPAQATQGVFQVMVAPPDSTPAGNIPASFRNSASFSVNNAGGQLVEGSPGSSSESSQSSGTSSTPDPPSTSDTANTSTESTEPSSSPQSPSPTVSDQAATVTVTKSPDSSQDSTTAVPVGAIVGGLTGSLVLIIGLIFIIMRLRRRTGKASAKRTASEVDVVPYRFTESEEIVKRPSLFLELNEDINGLPTLTKITSDFRTYQSDSDTDRSWTGLGTGTSQSNDTSRGMTDDRDDTSLNGDAPPSYSSHYSSR
ncbi:hypothetical protein VKT23_006234 [Stygiomarasmius scandens]|uniref:Mid2 domain-containing protein n=1 Tax=Marasmiellus scandens TaxID=2682957 RepID=A0ABR1JN58_9AGAR